MNSDVNWERRTHAEQDPDSELVETLNEISLVFTPLEKIAYRVLSLLGVIDLLVRV